MDVNDQIMNMSVMSTHRFILVVLSFFIIEVDVRFLEANLNWINNSQVNTYPTKKLHLPQDKEIFDEKVLVEADNDAIKEYWTEEKRIFTILKNYYENCSSQQSLQSYYNYVEKDWAKEEYSNNEDEADVSSSKVTCTSKTRKRFKKLISFPNYIPKRKKYEDQVISSNKDMVKALQENLECAPEEDETFAIMYTIYVAFWLSINFRICSLMCTKNFQEDFKNMCTSNFYEVKLFIFYELKDKIKYIRKMKNKSKKSNYGLLSKITGIITDDVAEEISKLSLDFVTKKADLEKKEPDRYSNGIIKWNEIKEFKLNEKTYKTIFPFDEECQTSKMGPRDMYDNLYTQIKEQINLNVVAKIQNFFIQEITGNENSISMTYFEKYLMFPTFSASEVMWRDFLNEEFLKTNKIYATSIESYVISLIYHFRKINEKMRQSGKNEKLYELFQK